MMIMFATGVSQMVPWVDGRGASDAVPHTRDGAGCHTGSLWCARALQTLNNNYIKHYLLCVTVTTFT